MQDQNLPSANTSKIPTKVNSDNGSFKARKMDKTKFYQFWRYLGLQWLFFFFYDKTSCALRWYLKHQLVRRIVFTIVLVMIFRIAATITIPGVKMKGNENVDDGGFLSLMNLLGGGTITKFSIVALGISPFITSSIIVQLLSSDAFPPMARLAKGGNAGRRKLNIITRWITLALGVVQGIALAAAMVNDKTGTFTFDNSIASNKIVQYGFVLIIMLAGSVFSIFLGEQITDKGVSNGTSILIFSGIVSRLPSKFRDAYGIYIGSSNDHDKLFFGGIHFLIYVVAFVALLAILGFVQDSERKIPIQQTGSALAKTKEEMSMLPIKVNPAGVIPVIFASALLAIPLTIAQFLPVYWSSRVWMLKNLAFTAPIGLSIYVASIIIFTLYYAQIQVNPTKIAENFKKNGTFIPGIRPGEQTEKYLTHTIFRLSIFATAFLVILAALPYIEINLGMTQNITLGGTGMIILVNVAVQTIDQLKSRQTTSQLSKIKQRSRRATGADNIGELLW